MKIITDELINKYLDNEMNEQEIGEFNELLKSDYQALNKLKAARLVEQSVKKMETELAPADITAKVMQRLNTKYSVARQKPYFFYAMLSGFSVLMLGLIIALLGMIQVENGSQDKVSVLNQVGEFMSKNLSFNGVFAILESNNFLILGTGLIVILLITAFFIFDSHKSFKHKFTGVGH